MRHILLHRIVLAILLFTSLLSNSFAEGSVDFINYPGERLFYHAQVPQQLKVFVAEGEFLNFGASHVGITGGFITVYRPDGTVHSIFDNTGDKEGLAIINNHIEERAGPTGGGTLNAAGYEPGVIQAAAGEAGIWTFTLEFPSYNIQTFINLDNGDPWNRAEHQPLIQRVITSWDITVSQNAAANDGGDMLEGRVYSNEYAAIVNLVSATTSPIFYVLTRDGIEYEIIFGEVNPWGFQINSTSKGVFDGRLNPYYKSALVDDIIRTNSLAGLDPNQLYLWEPQAEDAGEFINNKVFFNRPNTDMSLEALVTDVFRNNTHTTWLKRDVNGIAVDFEFVSFSPVQIGGSFLPEGVMDVDLGTHIIFDLNREVSATVLLDLNYDGDYNDEVDRALYKTIGPGIDTLFWDARDGRGDKVEERDEPVNIDFKFVAGQGEVHIALADIEENPGGIIFRRLNGLDAPSEGVIYNHIPVGGGYSGGELPYQLEPSAEPYTYADYFGNRKYLDYYSFEALPFLDLSAELLFVKAGYALEDTDFDGIKDTDDADDDNDGIPDFLEYCGLTGGADCLIDDIAPFEDNDGDGVKNYLDNDDPSFFFPCDTIEFGVCREVRSFYDYDGDGRPNHLDNDSDNDGIFDVVEAGHGALDLDRDGMIDGDSIDFGPNGFYNAVATDPIALDANITYSILDTDDDGIPNFRDLDSDNDGIPEVVENGLHMFDTDDDGRLEVGDLMVSIEEFYRGIPIAVHTYLDENIPDASPDFDGDGVDNHLDLDADNDGIHDVAEAKYADPDDDAIFGKGLPDINADGVASVEDKVLLSPSGEDSPFFFEVYDSDGDGMPDFIDLDADNDGMHDVREANFSDGDNDGFLGTGVGTTTPGGITIADAILVPFRSTSLPMDWDGDGIPDFQDLDTDNDGIHDVKEHRLPDPDNDGYAGISATITGFGQVEDTDGTVLATSTFQDTDLDGVPDFRDRDSDNDGIHDVAEASLADGDGDGVIGTGTPTVDANGRAAEVTSEPGDADNDMVDNYVDLDSDNDGLLDVYEGGNEDPDMDGIIGTGTPTVDTYGIPSGATSEPNDADSNGIPDYLSLDSDSDGIPDVIEARLSDPDLDGLLGSGTPEVDANGVAGDENATPPIVTASTAVDTDGDGDADFRDTDSDDDGLLDADECPTLACRDLDEDGLEDFRDPDRDGDGLLDSFECSTGTDCPDLDEDGLPNIDDLDSDGDGLLDAEECPDGTSCPDEDGSTTIDVYEFTCHSANSPVLVRATLDATYCTGTDIVLSAENEGLDTDALSYTWTHPDGTEIVNQVNSEDPLTLEINSATNADEGIYTLVSVGDNGCSSIEVAVEVDVIDQPATPTLTAESKELCAGGVIEIDADVVASSGLSFVWYFDDGTTSSPIDTTASSTLILTDVQAENSGSYSMVIVGPNCESAPSNVEFIEVKPTITSANATNPSSSGQPICGGGAITLFADAVVGAQYLWTGPNGFSSTDQNPVISDIDADDEGEYSYTIEIPGCQIISSDTTEVFIQEQGNQPVIDGSATACIGGRTSMEVLNDYDVPMGTVILYEWYAAPAGNLVATTDTSVYLIDPVTADMPTTYYVEVSMGECRTIPSGFFDIEIQDAPSESAYIPEDAYTICEEDEIVVTASAPLNATGSWSTPSDVLIVTPDNEITTVTNLGSDPFILIWSLSSGSCIDFSRDTVFVGYPEPVEAVDDLFDVDSDGAEEEFNLVANDMIATGVDYEVSILEFPTQGTATVTSDGLLTYAPPTGYIGVDELTYQVCVEDCVQQCETATVRINVQPSDCKIPNIITPNNDGMNDTFIVPCSSQQPENEIMIFNRWGDKVFAARNYQNDWDGLYRGNQLPPGTYYYLYKSAPNADEELSGFITLVR